VRLRARSRLSGRLLALALALCAAPTLAQKAPAAADDAKRDRVAAALNGLELAEAERVLATLADPDLPEALALRASLHHHQGDYATAAELAARAVQNGGQHPQLERWRQAYALYAVTAEQTRGFEQQASADGRYVVSFAPGKDRLMVPYALEVLAAADRGLEEVFSVHEPGPLRLEILPNPSALAAVSGLAVDAIHTSGTVAISKWNKLMITSPTALVRGYPWADTVTHELVHMVVTRATQDRAPVWMQEGIAKLFERRWRGPDAGLRLDAASKGLLETATTEGKLLTFEQMHPSVALLPSQDDAALAFAQVSTLMQGFVRDHGLPALRVLLAKVKTGLDARKALGVAAGTSFETIEKAWRAGLPRKQSGQNVPKRLKLRFRGGNEQLDETEDVVTTAAKRHLRVGDLMWDRGRQAAAKKEYAKAHAADRNDPIVASRLARAALGAGDAAAAVAALEPQLALYPEHAPIQAMLGAARLKLGRTDAAREALREALLINPFDPQPHCDLAGIEPEPLRAERERQACQALGAQGGAIR
jgi:tetratricopeptide (TPR) repeat protein